MFNSLIKKVIARDGEREILESDVEEMHKFIVEGIRPEFDDKNVICVKFIQNCSEEESEGTVWYINPYYTTPTDGNENIFYTPERGYGPFMDTSFIPEILLICTDDINVVLKKFANFNACLDYFGVEDSTDEEKLAKFMEVFNELEV